MSNLLLAPVEIRADSPSGLLGARLSGWVDTDDADHVLGEPACCGLVVVLRPEAGAHGWTEVRVQAVRERRVAGKQ